MSDLSEPSPGFDIQLSAGLSAELTSSPDAALHGRESLALAEDRTLSSADNIVFQAHVATATALSSDVPSHGIARFRRFKHDDSVNSVCYHPIYPSFGLLATGSSDGFARIFDAATGKEKLRTMEHEEPVTSVCWSPEGSKIATASGTFFGDENAFARVFDAESGTEILRTVDHESMIRSICFSRDGSCIATGSGLGVRIFDVSSGKEVLKAIEHGDAVNSVCFGSGNSIATGCDDKFLRVFDATSGKEILNAMLHGDSVTSVCFSADGMRIATCSYDGYARIFDFFSGKEVLKTVHFSGMFTSICFSPDGKNIATGNKDDTARIFDAESGKEVLKTMEHGGFVTSVSFSPDGNSMATGGYDGLARIFDIGAGKETFKTVKNEGDVASFFFSADGNNIATAIGDNVARIFDAASGEEILKTQDFGSKVLSMCFSPDYKLFATGSVDMVVRIFDVSTGKVILTTTKHQSSVFSVCFAPDGTRIATGCHDKFARVFDVTNGQEMMKTLKHGDAVKSVCFSADGKNIATGSGDNFARIFDATSGREVVKAMRHGGVVTSVCYSLDGKWIATSSIDRFARIFDASNGKEIMKTIEHGGVVSSVSFSHDNKCIATSCGDKFARIFNLTKTGYGEQIDGDDDYDEEEDEEEEEEEEEDGDDNEEDDNDNVGGHHLDDDDDDEDGNDKISNCESSRTLEICMIFNANGISLAANNAISLSHGSKLRVLYDPHNFATDSWLPVSPGIVLEWCRLPFNLQNQCYCSDSQVVVGEFCSPNGGGLVVLASKWQDPEIGHMVLSTLERLFNGEEPVVNAGLILRELLNTGISNKLPHAATIEALLRNVCRNVSFASRDEHIALQLGHATSIPSIQKIISEFWIEGLQLAISKPIVHHKVDQFTFSDTTRMYVASSNSTDAPVFENHFKKYPQAKGSPLDFEALHVPFPNASEHLDSSNSDGKTSMMQALVDTGNIDIFGTLAIRAIVQYKWQMFGLKRWVQEFSFYIVGLVLLVVLGVLVWQQLSPERDFQGSSLPADTAVVSVLYGTFLIRSAYREIKQITCSIPVDDQPLMKRIMSSLSDHFKDFWNWLDLLHIVLGCSVVILVWVQSLHLLPVLAVTSFLRWWGTLFYLQAFDKSGPYVRMLVEIVKQIKWFMLIMLISILATWNSFMLLLKRRCTELDSDPTCEMPRDVKSLFFTMYDMINTLLFGNGDVSTLEQSEYFLLVVIIFIISMIAMPIVLLNMLIAIMGDSYELIQDRSLRETVMMKASILLEIELFMSDSDKRDDSFFPKQVDRFLHVIVPEGEAKAGPSEYQGLMNALKRKIDESTHVTKDGMDKMQKKIEAHQADTAALKAELIEQSLKHRQETQALNNKLSEILDVLQSRN